MEDEVHILAKESTTDELLAKINDLQQNGKLHLSAETISNLKRVLQNADLVKFAKYSTQNNEKNYYLGNVVDYIEETKNGYQPPKTPQPTDTETEEKRNQRIRNILRWCKYGAIIAAIACATIAVWGIAELLN